MLAAVPGDANNDGVVNSQDIQVIIDHILQKITAAGMPDCNQDGKVDVRDVVCVINLINSAPPALFTLTSVPGTADVIRGQSVSYAVTLNSSTGFAQLASLSVSGLPSGVTASFKPQQIAAGQTAVLTVSAPSNQPLATKILTVSASATVNGSNVTQSVSPCLFRSQTWVNVATGICEAVS